VCLVGVFVESEGLGSSLGVYLMAFA